MTDVLNEADTLAKSREWGAAAVLYAQVAARKTKEGDRDGARAAWEAAGEAWRRDDRPLSASQALGLAIELSDDVAAQGLVKIKLAGVLGELGEAGKALELCRQAVRALPPGPLRAMALDSEIDALHALGRKDDARAVLADLVQVGKGPLQVAVWFREGQLFRLDGELGEAVLRYGLVCAELEGIADALPGVAAAEAELGEVAALRGDLAEALGLYDRAIAHFQETGRKALVWRAEAGRVRAAVDAGVQPLIGDLTDGIEYARAREMHALEAELLVGRGVGTSSEDPTSARADFQRAIVLSDAAGNVPRAGRARLEAARRLDGPDEERLMLVDRAEEELAGNLPWLYRAKLCRAWLTSREDVGVARTYALQALARFEHMEMERDAQEARDLLRAL